MSGPLTTPDQIEIETLAVRLKADPKIAAAIEEIGARWLRKVQPDVATLARFETQFEVAAFCGHMNAANNDPLYPRIHAFGRIEHETNGYRIPSTKSAHPNVDYIYRLVPIDGTSRYELHGIVPDVRPLVIEYAMLTAGQVYQNNVSYADIVMASDGKFTITVDPNPAGDRPNHFQTTHDSVQLLLRDVISDPATQRPIALEIERLGPPPQRERHDLETMSANVARLVQKHIDDIDYTTFEIAMKGQANNFQPPMVHRSAIYSVAQAYSSGHFEIALDEALVATLTLGGAAYAVVPATDLWGGVGDMLVHQTALGSGMAAANPNGSYTFVVAHADPGVSNWVDPGGVNRGVMFFRWIGLDPTSSAQPQLEVDLVKFSDLAHILPADIPRMSADERAIWLERRRYAYERMFG